MLLNVSVLSPDDVVFKGEAMSVIVPGEQGEFEVLPFHKRIVSRLLFGTLYIDEEEIPIKRGIINVDQNEVTVIIERR